MTAALRLAEDSVGRSTTREVLEELLADSSVCWDTFEEACASGAPALRESVLGFREALQERSHVFETHEKQFEEVFEVLLAVAEELLPETPGAARGRLRERVREDVRPRSGGGVRITGSVSVRRAVEITLAHEHGFFDEFILASSVGHARLYAVGRRIRDGLTAIGCEYAVKEVEDELWMLVREIAPESPAARPDAERLHSLWTSAQEYVSTHDPGGALGVEVRQGHEIIALNALRAYDVAGYRDALRELCRAARYVAREENGDEGEG